MKKRLVCYAVSVALLTACGSVNNVAHDFDRPDKNFDIPSQSVRPDSLTGREVNQGATTTTDKKQVSTPQDNEHHRYRRGLSDNASGAGNPIAVNNAAAGNNHAPASEWNAENEPFPQPTVSVATFDSSWQDLVKEELYDDTQQAEQTAPISEWLGDPLTEPEVQAEFQETKKEEPKVEISWQVEPGAQLPEEKQPVSNGDAFWTDENDTGIRKEPKVESSFETSLPYQKTENPATFNQEYVEDGKRVPDSSSWSYELVN